MSWFLFTIENSHQIWECYLQSNNLHKIITWMSQKFYNILVHTSLKCVHYVIKAVSTVVNSMVDNTGMLTHCALLYSRFESCTDKCIISSNFRTYALQVPTGLKHCESKPQTFVM